MRAGFENVVLEVVIVQQHDPLLLAQRDKLRQAGPVPGVVLRQVVLAQSVPGSADAAAGERLLVKRRPHVAIHPADTLMIVAAAVVPEAIVVLERDDAVGCELIGHLVQIIGETETLSPRDKARNGWPGAADVARRQPPRPPGNTRAAADRQLAVQRQPAVGDSQQALRLWR